MGVSGKKIKSAWFAALVILIAAAGCAGPGGADNKAERAADGKIRVFVSIPPQEYFVERIGGDLVNVQALVQPGQSPHSYQPSPRIMEDLARASIYFSIGVPFETAVIENIRSMNASLSIVDTNRTVILRKTDKHHDEPGEHGHDEGELDPHTWLDPQIVKEQAAAICEELSRLDPDNEAVYRENLDAFSADLDKLHAGLSAALAPLEGRKFFVFHPAFGYFGRAYGLVQTAVETGGKEPSAKQLASLIDQAKADRVKVIFVQAQFPSKSANAVAAAIGGAVVQIDPLAKEYIGNMKTITDSVKAALED